MDEEPTEVPTLDALVEVPLPEPVSNAPATPAWTVLFVVCGLVLLVVALLLWRRWRKNAYRRRGLRRLDDLVARGRGGELPALLKRVALDAWPREDVASLTGDAWLAFLDRAYGGTEFSRGAGRALPALAYENPEGPPHDALVALARTWIRRHRVSRPRAAGRSEKG